VSEGAFLRLWAYLEECFQYFDQITSVWQISTGFMVHYKEKMILLKSDKFRRVTGIFVVIVYLPRLVSRGRNSSGELPIFPIIEPVVIPPDVCPFSQNMLMHFKVEYIHLVIR
jgi:hypothetical protein